MITAFLCLIPFLNKGAMDFFRGSYGLTLFFAIMGLVFMCAMVCVPSLTRSVPLNYILLLTFTFCEGWIVAYCCAVVGDALTVLTAAFMTAGMVVGLTLYAITTKHDFTLCMGTLWVMGSVFFVFSLFSIMFGPTLNMVFCIFGVILFGIYLIVDT